MIIYLNDKTNSANLLYYQSLCLLYLPCEHFTEQDTSNKMYVDAFVQEGVIYASVRLEVGDRISEFSDSAPEIKSEKRAVKNLIGRCVLYAFEKLFGILPPWGISTGVKPVKLAKEYIGTLGEMKAFEYLQKEYMFCTRKARLSVEAARFEDEIMSDMPKNACSMYVSIPFCPTRCDYCSFVTSTTPRLLELIPSYLQQLKADITIAFEAILQSGLSLQSIYIGGGTPAVLDQKQIYSLLFHISQYCGGFSDLEFTFEAGRPDCITKEKLQVLRNFNVGRISINPQSTNDEVLKNVGRAHTSKQFFECYEMARSIGFDCINTDLIAGLPTDTLESFKNSVDDVCALSPENVTVHSFTLKKSSRFRTEGQTDITSSYALASDMLDYSADKLSGAGYNPYYVYRQKNTVGNLDNTGYAKSGFGSIYNLAMMGEHHTVIACGAGAVTKLVPVSNAPISRIFSPKYPYEYLDKDKYKGFDKDSVINFYKSQKGEF